MTNLDKWQSYTAGLPSPDNYISWGWYYTIAAALQRRVWIGPIHQPCYPNMYVILVGAPGIGKGLTIKASASLLKHWNLEISNGASHIAKTADEKALVEDSVDSNLRHAKETEHQGKVNGARDAFKPLLIPVCADAITYEALVKAVGESYRYINFVTEDSNGKRAFRAYGHSSLCFLLEELSSLMRKRTHDTVNYLLGLYDCPVDYEYTTLTRGKDRVRRGCLNILAGTTPSFMSSTFDEELIGEGFTSRTFYIYATKNRKNVMWIPPLTAEQEQHKKELLDHIKKLTTIYGEVRVSQETKQWLVEWWDDYCNKNQRANKAVEMVPYYARKNVHVFKLAMAMHFGENAEMDSLGRPANEISREIFQKAIDFLDKEEANMHLCLRMEGNNPMSRACQKIMEMVAIGRTNAVDIYISCRKFVNDREQLNEAVEFLITTNQIRQLDIVDETTQEPKIWYEKV
jgi:hypothetical protein